MSPSSGSSSGGTLLTITGAGFASNKDDISVDIDGVPCEVINASWSEIVCWTGAPEMGSKVIPNEVGGSVMFVGVESGFRFKGE